MSSELKKLKNAKKKKGKKWDGPQHATKSKERKKSSKEKERKTRDSINGQLADADWLH